MLLNIILVFLVIEINQCKEVKVKENKKRRNKPIYIIVHIENIKEAIILRTSEFSKVSRQKFLKIIYLYLKKFEKQKSNILYNV